MLTLWYYRLVGTLAAGVCDVLSVLGILTQIAPTVSGYYAVTMVDYRQHRGGILGVLHYIFKKG